MPKDKKKKKDDQPDQCEQREDISLEEEEETAAWLAKYTGENHMTWFVGILKTHASKAVREIMPELERKFNEKIEKVQRKASEDIEAMRSENKKLSRAVERLQFQLHKKEVKINELEVKVDCLEQKDFINEVQMVGLAESASEEEDMKKVLKLAKDKMGVKLKKSDVKSVTRLGKKSNKVTPRDLVVSFNEQTAREAFYNKRKNLVPSKVPQNNIYVNDRLTNHRKALFYEARKLYKSRKLYAAWTQKGNVLVRQKEDGPIKQINSFEDLRMLTGNRLGSCNSSMEISSPDPSYSAEISSHLSDYDIYVEP